MENVRTFTFPSADGAHQIFAQEWRPEGEPRGVVQLVHGVAEHVGRYDGFARFLAGQGFLVCGEDHLGHGRTVTDGQYGYFAPRDGWQLLVRDNQQLRRLVGSQHPGVPYFLLGHSMGSFLTRTYLIDYPGDVAGAILSGTGQEAAPLVAFGRGVSSLLCRLRGDRYVSPLVYQLSLGAYNQKFRPNRTSADWISRDEGAVDAYLADPLCTFRPTVGMFRDMMGGLQYIARRDNLSRMDPDTPVRFFSGDQDPVGSMGAGVRKVEAMFRAAGCREVSVRLYPGGRHEMLNEINRAQVWQDVLDWLEERLDRGGRGGKS